VERTYAKHSIMRKAMYVEGVMPPLDPTLEFLARLQIISFVRGQTYNRRFLLDCAPNKLSKVSRDNPKSKVFSTSTRRAQGHNRSGFGNIPAAGTDAAQGTTKNQILKPLLVYPMLLH
jgi:hypothetical protein